MFLPLSFTGGSQFNFFVIAIAKFKMRYVCKVKEKREPERGKIHECGWRDRTTVKNDLDQGGKFIL